MKKPFIINMQDALDALEKYKKSPENLAKLESARKAYERDKVWLEPLLAARKAK